MYPFYMTYDYIRKTDRKQGFLTWGMLLRFIDSHIKEHGYAPVYKEMAAAMNVASTSTIAHHMDFLVARGYITQLPRRSRTAQLTDKGREALAPKAANESTP